MQRMFRSKKFQVLLDQLRSGLLVEYDAVETLKMGVLEDLFRGFSRHHLADPVRHAVVSSSLFVRRSPGYLTRFCKFQALREYFHGYIMAAMAGCLSKPFVSRSSKSFRNLIRVASIIFIIFSGCVSNSYLA